MVCVPFSWEIRTCLYWFWMDKFAMLSASELYSQRMCRPSQPWNLLRVSRSVLFLSILTLEELEIPSNEATTTWESESPCTIKSSEIFSFRSYFF